VTPLVDATPYIIVDNKRVFPIERSAASGSATRKQKESCALEFGIVDRVTISEEAREKSRRYRAPTGSFSAVGDGLPQQSSAPSRPLLTYSPKQRR